MRNIPLTVVQELRTTAPAQPKGHAFLSAGSGLVFHQEHFYVVADDELCMGKFSLGSVGSFIPLFPGVLSMDAALRKRAKPDLEALFLFEDELVALPSGSTPMRTTAVRHSLSTGKNKIFDCSDLYGAMRLHFSELNLEGAVLKADHVLLFQRGNGKLCQNGLIRIDRELRKVLSMKDVSLGKIEGVPLSFTDGASYGERIFFVAAAENSNSTYEDGACVGSVIGEIVNGEPKVLGHLEGKHKPEGLWVSGNEFYVVTDNDDPSRPSLLMKGTF